MNPAVTRAIAAIPEATWTAVKYPRAQRTEDWVRHAALLEAEAARELLGVAGSVPGHPDRICPWSGSSETNPACGVPLTALDSAAASVAHYGAPGPALRRDTGQTALRRLIDHRRPPSAGGNLPMLAMRPGFR